METTPIKIELPRYWKLKWWLANKFVVPVIRQWHKWYDVHLEVSFFMDECDFIEVSDLISDTVKMHSTGSGAGCGTRDMSFIGSRRQVLTAVKKLNEISVAHPEWELIILDSINDSEFLGIGY